MTAWKTRSTRAACLALFSLFVSKTVYAKVLTSTALNLYFERSDNVFSAPASNAVGGYTYLISPTLSVSMPGKKMRSDFAYTFTLEENIVDGDGGVGSVTPNSTPVQGQGDYGRRYHDFSAGFQWDMTRKLSWNLTGAYGINFQSIQPGQTANFAPNEQTRTDTTNISLSLLWRPTKKLNVDFNLAKNAITYGDDTLADMDTISWRLTSSYNLTKRVQIGLGAIFSDIGYGSAQALPGVTAGGVAQNFSDRKQVEYNANISVDLKYITLGVSYGILQRIQAGTTITTTTFGNANIASVSGGLTSIFTLNITTNQRTFKVKNFIFDISLSQNFFIDIAGLPYTTRIIIAGVTYTRRPFTARLALSRNQDDYLDNDNSVVGTTGSLDLGWDINKRATLALTGSITKFEYTTDELASTPTNLPTSFPANRNDNIVQEIYLNFSYSLAEWLSVGASIGRRESVTIGSVSGINNIQNGEYVENILSLSATATY